MTLTTATVIVRIPPLGTGKGFRKLTLTVEDTSFADAPSTMLTQLVVVLHSARFDAGGDVTLAVPFDGPAADLTVAATLSVDAVEASEAPTSLISPEAVPMRTDVPMLVRLAPVR